MSSFFPSLRALSSRAGVPMLTGCRMARLCELEDPTGFSLAVYLALSLRYRPGQPMAMGRLARCSAGTTQALGLQEALWAILDRFGVRSECHARSPPPPRTNHDSASVALPTLRGAGPEVADGSSFITRRGWGIYRMHRVPNRGFGGWYAGNP